jgi:hypothetical protein
MKVVHCPCGTDVSGETDDELVAAVEAHVQSDHPEMTGSRSWAWRTITDSPGQRKGRPHGAALRCSAALHETAAGAGSGRTTTVSTTGMTSSAGIGTVAACARTASGLSPS